MSQKRRPMRFDVLNNATLLNVQGHQYIPLQVISISNFDNFIFQFLTLSH